MKGRWPRVRSSCDYLSRVVLGREEHAPMHYVDHQASQLQATALVTDEELTESDGLVT
jgi:hypothetical protein